MQRIVIGIVALCVAAGVWPAAGSAIRTGAYNLTTLRNASVSTAWGQSWESKTEPAVLLSSQSQWQPGYNLTGGGTNGYDVVFDYKSVYDVATVNLQTHFRGSQSLQEFYVEGSTDLSSWTTIAHWTDGATSGFSYTNTPAAPVQARYLRYRVPAGQYSAVGTDQNYGGPGLMYFEAITSATTTFTTDNPNVATSFSQYGASVTVTNAPGWNRSGDVAGTIDGRHGTGGPAHNNATGWGAGATLDINLGSSWLVDAVEIMWGGRRDLRFSSDTYDLYSSLDGLTWTPVSYTKDATRRGTSSDLLTFSSEFRATYIRLANLTTPTVSWDPTVGIAQVMVYTIPEPASLGLLVLAGALPMLRRRR